DDLINILTYLRDDFRINPRGRREMITEIGIVAGDIWHFLDQHKEVTLSELVRGIDKPRDNILMSLGWLAREGHVILQHTEDDYVISLRKNV
ncbi:MAG: winged helix-turn-helix domain-containing protein, partial [Candidatus Omnitrophica bacterium]|nr:winged helix-turn-helix domain-containing protein [Candidatus Omnitrophota bacterium]